MLDKETREAIYMEACRLQREEALSTSFDVTVNGTRACLCSDPDIEVRPDVYSVAPVPVSWMAVLLPDHPDDAVMVLDKGGSLLDMLRFAHCWATARRTLAVVQCDHRQDAEAIDLGPGEYRYNGTVYEAEYNAF